MIVSNPVRLTIYTRFAELARADLVAENGALLRANLDCMNHFDALMSDYNNVSAENEELRTKMLAMACAQVDREDVLEAENERLKAACDKFSEADILMGEMQAEPVAHQLEALAFRPDWADFANGRECGRLEAAQPVWEPYDKTEMNVFAQALYNAKMQEGKHGHYETLFHVVHAAIARAVQPVVKESLSTQSAQPAREPLTDEQIGMAFRKVFPVGGVVFTNGVTEFARAIEHAHGIT
jgi:hypothetical protein